MDKRCIWGEALNVEDRYIYVTQPYLDRIIVISVPMLAVVEVRGRTLTIRRVYTVHASIRGGKSQMPQPFFQAIATDKFPVSLTYVPHTSQLWVLNWRSEMDRGAKTIQVRTS